MIFFPFLFLWEVNFWKEKDLFRNNLGNAFIFFKYATLSHSAMGQQNVFREKFKGGQGEEVENQKWFDEWRHWL